MGSGRVRENGLGEYQKGGIRESTENVGFRRVPEKGSGEYRKHGIQASTGKVKSG